MTTTQQPHPLYLAKQLDKYGDGTILVAADELRRLHSRVMELEAELEQSKASSHQYFLERNSARAAVNRYQKELEAIGAGGVESLRKKD